MTMLAGMPANRDFGFKHIAAHGGVTEVVRDHELYFGVMGRRNPRNIFVDGYEAAHFELILELVRRF